MSDQAAAKETQRRGFWPFIGRTILRHPTALTFVAVYLAVGIASTTLWTPLRQLPWHDWVAYGVPSFEAGRWWTVFTGAFFSEEPWHYAVNVVLLAVGIGVLEHRRGWKWAFFGFWIGQIGGTLAAFAFVDTLQLTGWHWAVHLATINDVGPSIGAFVVIALAIATLRSPWRFRGRLILGGALLIVLLLHGSLADLEHALSAGLVLLFGFGRGNRATVHEWRVIGFAAILTIGLMQLIAAVLPIDGPLGTSDALDVSWLDIAIDVVIIAIISWSLFNGRRWAWVIAILLAAYNIAQMVIGLTVYNGDLDWFNGGGIAAAASILWLITLVLLLVGWNAFAVPFWGRGRFLSVDVGDARARLLAVLRRYGGGTFSWMATWPLMRVRFGTDASGGTTWALPVRKVGGVAIVLGDPIGPRERWAEAIADFRNACDQQGVVPVLFSSSAAAAEAAMAEDPDWRSISVGEDTIVDLPGLEFTGKAWQPLRGAANRAEREGVTFRMTTLDAEPWAVFAQVRAISESWVGDKALPEMRFTLGGVDEAKDPAVRVALAEDAEGSIHAVLSWLPAYGPAAPDGEPVVRGWVLDIMRRRDDGFGPAMEFLIGQSMLFFRDEGAEFISLSGAPLTASEEDAEEDGALGAVLAGAANMLEPAYGFHSLHRFKQKFNPRYESMRLVFRDAGQLPKIATAIVRAYLPDATLGQLARAGFSLGKK